MALAFQDCCNTNNYFQVENIPGLIYEGSYYYILTTNGLQFCGQYTELPTNLGYKPISYNVQTLTKYSNCETCQNAKNLTCVETVNVIFASLPSGSNVTVSECECETIKVMTSFCNTQSITPGNTSAPLSIGIQGGTAPYKVYNNETNSLLSNPTSSSNNIVINSQAPEGTYSLRVEDSYSDFVQYLNCVINIPPAPLTITCLPTAPTIFGANNGRIQLNINGGVQPYTITFEGTASTVNGAIKLYQNLTADTYTYSIIDSGVGSEQQQLGPFNCTVVPGPQINYPTNLCVSISVCGTNYLLSFSWDGTTRQNYRPVYVCSNPSLIGAQQIQIYFNTTQGWITDAYNIGQFQTPQGCQSITNQFKIKQQTLNTSVNSQPTGNWVVPSPQYSFIGSTINVTGSLCVNAPIVVAPIQNSVICNNGSNSTQVSKTITVTSGNGPFTYYRNNSLIPSPTFNVGPGTYTYYVRGLNNTQSATQTFTVTSQIPTLLSYGSNCNYTIINNTVTNNIVSFASQGTVTTNWPTQIISNTTGTLINTSVSLQIRATVILRVELSSSYNINFLTFNTNNVNATLSTYNTNGTTYTIENWQEIFTGDWYQTNLGTGSCPVWERAISLLSSTFTINGGTSTIKPLIYIENFELPTVIDSNEVAGCNKPNISFTTEAVVAYLNSPNCINLAQQFEIYDVKQTYDLNNNQGFVYYSYNTPVASTLCGDYTGPNSLPSIPNTTGGVNATYFDHALNATILLPNQTLDELQTEGLLMYVKVTTDKNANLNTVNFYNNCLGMNLKLRVSLRYEVNRPANVSLNVTDLVPVNTWDWQNYQPTVTFGPNPDDFPSSPQLTTLEFNQISGPIYQNISGTVSCGNGGNFNYSSYGTYVWESGIFNLGANDLGSLNLINLNSIYAFNILDKNIAQPNGCPLELNWYVRADLINQGYDNSCGDFIYLGESNCYEFQIKFNDGSLIQQVTQGVVNPINNCVIPPP